jgi:putative hydrolase of the HAD superfamily
MPGVRAVTFDLDDTFWDGAGVIMRAEERLYAFLEASCPGFTARWPRERLRAEMARLAQGPKRRADLGWLRREALRIACRQVAPGHEDVLAEAAFAVFYEARHDVQLFPDVLPTVEQIASRYVVGTISNGNADIRRITSLGAHFKATISAHQVGAVKPEKAIFHAAALALGEQPAAIVHVGDDALRDCVGARQAGFRAIWFNRAQEEWPLSKTLRPDAIISRLGQLADVLEGWQE